jgi:endoglucanase
MGFNFVRLPMAYPRYIDFDESKNIRPAEVCNISEQKVEQIEGLIRRAGSSSSQP